MRLTPPTEPSARPAPIRVLVVDDDPAICRALSKALILAGYEALPAESGDEALATLAERHIDVMLIDLRIPDIRGDVVFELAAAINPHLRTAALFMTGDISERAHRLIVSCGCPYLRKPFELRELIDAVARLAPHRGRQVHGRQP